MEQAERTTGIWTGLIGAAVLGAVSMYLADPDRGRQRRATARDKVGSMVGKTEDAVNDAVTDFSHRLQGMQAQLRRLVRRDEHPVDSKLTARVRAKLGRAVSNPHAIGVGVQQGRVVLSGPVLAREKEALLDVVRSVDGVISITDRLDVHERPDNVAGLQGTYRRRPLSLLSAWREEHWSPALRSAAVIGGGALGYYGLTRRSPGGLALASIGLALLARGATNRRMKRMVGLGAAPRRIDLQKSIDIQASPEAVFDLWSNYENYPRFMSHVREVRDLGQGRSQWLVEGVPGAYPEWDFVLTEAIRPSVLSWRSEPDATVRNKGRIVFEPVDGGTRATVNLSYAPPAGALGRGIDMLLHADRQRQLEDDLMQMKAFIESSRKPREAPPPEADSGALLH